MIKWGSWRGGTSPISQSIFFRNPTSQCSNPIPTSRIWKKSQCYTYHLFSLRICKITASKCDPTKTQKFTRIYKDVLKITGSFQTVIKLSSSEFIAINPSHLYTNIVDRKSGPFGGNLDKNAKNWLEQGALAIFWRFLTPGNKWCLDWSWFQTIYPIPIFDILFPFPVTKSQSQWLKSHFPRAKTDQSQFPFYPFRTLSSHCVNITRME